MRGACWEQLMRQLEDSERRTNANSLEGWLLLCLVCSVCAIFLLGRILGPLHGREETGRDEQEEHNKEPPLLHTYYMMHRYYSLLPT